MENLVIEFNNFQRKIVFGSKWKTFVSVRSYIRLIHLAGIYKSKHEPLPSLWDDHKGRAILMAAMPLCRFQDG